MWWVYDSFFFFYLLLIYWVPAADKALIRNWSLAYCSFFALTFYFKIGNGLESKMRWSGTKLGKFSACSGLKHEWNVKLSTWTASVLALFFLSRGKKLHNEVFWLRQVLRTKWVLCQCPNSVVLGETLSYPEDVGLTGKEVGVNCLHIPVMAGNLQHVFLPGLFLLVTSFFLRTQRKNNVDRVA